MEKHREPLSEELPDSNDIRNLRQIGRGLEYRTYLSKDTKYVIKVPRTYMRVLGMLDFPDVEENILRCKEYVERNKLPILIAQTRVARYRNSPVIIQEYVEGEPNKELTKKITGGLDPLPIEENFIDLRSDNILHHRGKSYLIDISGGFYYRFAQRFGKKRSKLLWHSLQMFKLSFRPSKRILYEEDKTYINLEFANFLESLSNEERSAKRLRILLWHVTRIFSLLFK